MAKIILSMGNVVLREIALAKERITIGRGPHNDIVIDDGAISADHAVIVTVGDDAFLEDLNSTNGTQVNGQPMRKHFLRDGDVIELPGYLMAYDAKQLGNGEDDDTLRSIGATDTSPPLKAKRCYALIKIMSGPSAGKEIVLEKTITTLGRPGMQVVAITKRSQKYYVMYVDGVGQPTVNGKPFGDDAIEISNGDMLELSEAHMQFVVALP